jgi:hypothetical protein
VTLRPFLGFMAGAQALRILTTFGVGTGDQLNEQLGPIYLREGPIGWNLVDEDGPVEFDPEAILELPFEQAFLIANACDDLYTERLVAPLVAKMNALSQSTPTTNGTSRTSRSSRKHLTPVEPSSPATSADGRQRAG